MGNPLCYNFRYNPLDSTLIHPESYEMATQVLKSQGFTSKAIGSKRLIDHFRLLKGKDHSLVNAGIATCTELEQILDSLRMKTNSDIRESIMAQPLLRSEILTIDGIYEGQRLQGSVKNVTHFGAFVDIGVGKDALLHSSNFKSGDIKLGQSLEVVIMSVDKSRGRIGLRQAT
jgi:uncharacterized protein